MIHANAIVEPGAVIGQGTRIWAFTHVLGEAVIGAECNICDHVFIEGGVRVGDRVTIKCGVQLWRGVTLEDDVFVGPNATFTNDVFPRSKDYPTEFARTLIKRGATIGANATILAGRTIGANAMVGAGAVVTKDVPPNAIVVGSPAYISGYVSSRRKGPIPVPREGVAPEDLTVEGVRLIPLPLIDDLRGRLAVGEHETHLPFLPRRFFVVYDVPTREVRGEHAHRSLQQVLVCLRGAVEVLVDDGTQRAIVPLNTPAVGLHIRPLTWASQYKYTADAMLLVLASDRYDASDYIRSYEEFLELKRSSKRLPPGMPPT